MSNAGATKVYPQSFWAFFSFILQASFPDYKGGRQDRARRPYLLDGTQLFNQFVRRHFAADHSRRKLI